MSGPNVETLNHTGLRQLLDLAADEGWNPGIGDVAAFRAVDPDGFLCIREGDELVAGIGVVRLDERNGFLGLYIANPTWRGMGHGFRLWQEALARLESRGVESIGLDGVIEQQANYRRSGFEFLHRNLRFVGPADRLLALTRDRSAVAHRRETNTVDRAAAKALDHAVGAVARDAFLDEWLVDRDDRYSLSVQDATGGEGFGTVRRCLEGWKMGPLVASTQPLAEQLLAGLAELAVAKSGHSGAGVSLTIDVPEGNRPALQLLEKADFEQTFETARMYRGPAPVIDTARLWGVATLELG